MLDFIYTNGMLSRNKASKLVILRIFLTVLSLYFFSNSVYGSGSAPDWDKIEKNDQKDIDKDDSTSEMLDIIDEPSPPEEPLKDTLLNEESLDLARKTYERLLKQKQFKKALINLEKIPIEQRRRSESQTYEKLFLFQEIERSSKNQSNLFNEDDELNDQQKEITKKLYREAQNALLTNQYQLAKDLLIHIVYIHRRNYKAKQLLERGLEIRTGDYHVENIEDKYWNKSKTYFYGGNYEMAQQALQTLTYFDKDNAEIYQRLGSSYYMSGENEKAIEAWTTALFLDPENTKLEVFINKAKETADNEKKEAKLRREERKKARQETQKDKKNEEDYQLLGVYSDQTKAYSYAQKLKAEGIKGIIEELENGKWAVKVPKKTKGDI